jgi:hypothetical protein
MVYCTKCGTQNPDTANNCYNCGSPLVRAETPNAPPYRHHARDYSDEYRYYRHSGAGFGLLFAGAIIIVIALAAFLNIAVIWTYFWAIVFVLLGIWLITLGAKRNRRIQQPPPQ